MYTPEAFRLDDNAAAAELVRRHGFGLLVTAVSGAPVATHLPFLIDAARGARGTLLGHLARANPQARDLAALAQTGGEALAVFQGPHAYVSPRWYRPGSAVPTWNYLAVHAYGIPRVLDDPDRVRALLVRLVGAHEAGADPPWTLETQSDSYLAGMQRGIVAFELPIARLQAKAKLSQNRSGEDRRGVIEGLEATGDPEARALVGWMAKLATGD